MLNTSLLDTMHVKSVTLVNEFFCKLTRPVFALLIFLKTASGGIWSYEKVKLQSVTLCNTLWYEFIKVQRDNFWRVYRVVRRIFCYKKIQDGCRHTLNHQLLHNFARIDHRIIKFELHSHIFICWNVWYCYLIISSCQISKTVATTTPNY